MCEAADFRDNFTPESKAKVGTLTDHLENYKPERDETGTAIAPSAASSEFI